MAIMEGLVFMENCNVYSRHPLHRRLLSARCSWVYTPEADFTGLIKACVCKYTCIHTCTSAQECGVKVSSSDPPGWSRTDLTWKAKFQGGKVCPRCSLCGIKECFQARLVFWSRVRGLKLCVKESHENRGRALADDIRKEKCKIEKKTETLWNTKILMFSILPTREATLMKAWSLPSKTSSTCARASLENCLPISLCHAIPAMLIMTACSNSQTRVIFLFIWLCLTCCKMVIRGLLVRLQNPVYCLLHVFEQATEHYHSPWSYILDAKTPRNAQFKYSSFTLQKLFNR